MLLCYSIGATAFFILFHLSYYVYAIMEFRKDYITALTNRHSTRYRTISDVYRAIYSLDISDSSEVTGFILITGTLSLLWFIVIPIALLLGIAYFPYLLVKSLILKINNSIRPSVDRKYPELKV